MGAMFGAILFAYAGLNVALFLLPWVHSGPFMEAILNERTVTQVFRLLVAGLAIVWTIPPTALLSSWLASPQKRAGAVPGL